jgi:hypothetical protein
MFVPLNTKTHINTIYDWPFMFLIRIIAHLKLYLHVGYIPNESHDTCLKTLSFGNDCHAHKSCILLLCASFWGWFHLSFIAIESQWKNENLFLIKPLLSGLVVFFHIGLMHKLSLIMHIHVIQANWIPATYLSFYEFPSIL